VQTRTVFSEVERGHSALSTHLHVLIADTGEGLDDEALERALDPYYTSRPGHPGLGLGQAWACMRAHRGDLELDSVPGRGTQVRLLLPLRENRTDAGLRRNAGRVLLVDDDDVVRGVVCSILRSLGWEVEAFPSGPEALAWMDAGWQGVDLALLDLRMPRMNGWELLGELRQRDPGLRALLMTAWADDLPRERLRSGEILGILSKPFELDELHAALEMAMQRLDGRAT
jgi:CheY-like chemotaxis protein